MKKLKFLSTWILIFSILFSFNAHADYTLQQALQTAFDKNKRTAENEQRLQYARERLRARWQRVYLPPIYLEFSHTRSRDKDNAFGADVITRSVYGTTSASLNVNLWRGGADVAAAEAEEMRVQALEATNNSTDALLPNTKGAIATLVEASFLDILYHKEALQGIAYVREKIMKYRASLKDPAQIEALNRVLQSIQAQEKKALGDLEMAQDNFMFAVTEPAPDNMVSFEDVIESLVIPESFEMAFQEAMKNSPELRASEYRLKAAELGYSAAKKAAHSPSVDLSISKGKERYTENGVLLSRNTGTTVGVSITIPFSIPEVTAANAEALNVASLRSSRDAAIEDLRHELGQVYKKKNTHESQLALYKQNMAVVVASLEKLSEDIDNGNAIDFNRATPLFGEFGQIMNITLGYKWGLTDAKFKTQKLIGSLFDETKTMLLIQRQNRH